MYGFSPNPSDLDCDLYWDNYGTERAPCPGCDWAFDVDFVYDASSSYDGADCFGGGATDWTWGFGYQPNYYGSYGAIYYDYYGDWQPAFLAYESGGTVYWGGGYYQYPYFYGGTYYYYTRLWQGAAVVS
jgi:hypothetical protein